MESVTELLRIGNGPSSSHSMGPMTASKLFKKAYPNADSYRVVLYGSLAKTGKGHLTDKAVKDAFSPKDVEIIFDTDTEYIPHPNTMDIYALTDGIQTGRWRIKSVGGGKIVIEGQEEYAAPEIYPHSTFAEIKKYCETENIRLWQYVERFENDDIWDYLTKIWLQMKSTIRSGLLAEGTLPGSINVERKAKYLYNRIHIDESQETRETRIVSAYAFACGEENASGGKIVTAPTCGACGVVPSVLLYMQEKRGFSDRDMLHALAVAGLIGDIIKKNASISGAECGCQAEIGSACSMASAALAELFGMSLDQIEYAAEVALEHHLGLTCDPICGLVQIPCIERNAVAAMRAITALSLANFLTHTRKISFDMVVETMYETGRDLFSKYRETAEGGLAKLYKG